MPISPLYSSARPISVHLECGDVAGWVDEQEARRMIAGGLATVQSQRHGVPRRVILTASENAPLTPSARRQAAASYVGGMKATYREDLNTDTATHSVAPLVMLKRVSRDGEMSVWDKRLTFSDLRNGRMHAARAVA